MDQYLDLLRPRLFPKPPNHRCAINPACSLPDCMFQIHSDDEDDEIVQPQWIPVDNLTELLSFPAIEGHRNAKTWQTISDRAHSLMRDASDVQTVVQLILPHLTAHLDFSPSRLFTETPFAVLHQAMSSDTTGLWFHSPTLLYTFCTAFYHMNQAYLPHIQLISETLFQNYSNFDKIQLTKLLAPHPDILMFLPYVPPSVTPQVLLNPPRTDILPPQPSSFFSSAHRRTDHIHSWTMQHLTHKNYDVISILDLSLGNSPKSSPNGSKYPRLSQIYTKMSQNSPSTRNFTHHNAIPDLHLCAPCKLQNSVSLPTSNPAANVNDDDILELPYLLELARLRALQKESVTIDQQTLLSLANHPQSTLIPIPLSEHGQFDTNNEETTRFIWNFNSNHQTLSNKPNTPTSPTIITTTNNINTTTTNDSPGGMAKLHKRHSNAAQMSKPLKPPTPTLTTTPPVSAASSSSSRCLNNAKNMENQHNLPISLETAPKCSKNIIHPDSPDHPATNTPKDVGKLMKSRKVTQPVTNQPSPFPSPSTATFPTSPTTNTTTHRPTTPTASHPNHNNATIYATPLKTKPKSPHNHTSRLKTPTTSSPTPRLTTPTTSTPTITKTPSKHTKPPSPPPQPLLHIPPSSLSFDQLNIHNYRQYIQRLEAIITLGTFLHPSLLPHRFQQLFHLVEWFGDLLLDDLQQYKTQHFPASTPTAKTATNTPNTAGNTPGGNIPMVIGINNYLNSNGGHNTNIANNPFNSLNNTSIDNLSTPSLSRTSSFSTQPASTSTIPSTPQGMTSQIPQFPFPTSFSTLLSTLFSFSAFKTCTITPIVLKYALVHILADRPIPTSLLNPTNRIPTLSTEPTHANPNHSFVQCHVHMQRERDAGADGEADRNQPNLPSNVTKSPTTSNPAITAPRCDKKHNGHNLNASVWSSSDSSDSSVSLFAPPHYAHFYTYPTIFPPLQLTTNPITAVRQPEHQNGGILITIPQPPAPFDVHHSNNNQSHPQSHSHHNSTSSQHSRPIQATYANAQWHLCDLFHKTNFLTRIAHPLLFATYPTLPFESLLITIIKQSHFLQFDNLFLNGQNAFSPFDFTRNGRRIGRQDENLDKSLNANRNIVTNNNINNDNNKNNNKVSVSPYDDVTQPQTNRAKINMNNPSTSNTLSSPSAPHTPTPSALPSHTTSTVLSRSSTPSITQQSSSTTAAFTTHFHNPFSSLLPSTPPSSTTSSTQSPPQSYGFLDTLFKNVFRKFPTRPKLSSMLLYATNVTELLQHILNRFHPVRFKYETQNDCNVSGSSQNHRSGVKMQHHHSHHNDIDLEGNNQFKTDLLIAMESGFGDQFVSNRLRHNTFRLVNYNYGAAEQYSQIDSKFVDKVQNLLRVRNVPSCAGAELSDGMCDASCNFGDSLGQLRISSHQLLQTPLRSSDNTQTTKTATINAISPNASQIDLKALPNDQDIKFTTPIRSNSVPVLSTDLSIARQFYGIDFPDPMQDSPQQCRDGQNSRNCDTNDKSCQIGWNFDGTHASAMATHYHHDELGNILRPANCALETVEDAKDSHLSTPFPAFSQVSQPPNEDAMETENGGDDIQNNTNQDGASTINHASIPHNLSFPDEVVNPSFIHKVFPFEILVKIIHLPSLFNPIKFTFFNPPLVFKHHDHADAVGAVSMNSNDKVNSSEYDRNSASNSQPIQAPTYPSIRPPQFNNYSNTVIQPYLLIFDHFPSAHHLALQIYHLNSHLHSQHNPHNLTSSTYLVQSMIQQLRALCDTQFFYIRRIIDSNCFSHFFDVYCGYTSNICESHPSCPTVHANHDKQITPFLFSHPPSSTQHHLASIPSSNSYSRSHSSCYPSSLTTFLKIIKHVLVILSQQYTYNYPTTSPSILNHHYRYGNKHSGGRGANKRDDQHFLALFHINTNSNSHLPSHLDYNSTRCLGDYMETAKQEGSLGYIAQLWKSATIDHYCSRFLQQLILFPPLVSYFDASSFPPSHSALILHAVTPQPTFVFNNNQNNDQIITTTSPSHPKFNNNITNTSVSLINSTYFNSSNEKKVAPLHTQISQLSLPLHQPWLNGLLFFLLGNLDRNYINSVSLYMQRLLIQYRSKVTRVSSGSSNSSNRAMIDCPLIMDHTNNNSTSNNVDFLLTTNSDVQLTTSNTSSLSSSSPSSSLSYHPQHSSQIVPLLTTTPPHITDHVTIDFLPPDLLNAIRHDTLNSKDVLRLHSIFYPLPPPSLTQTLLQHTPTVSPQTSFHSNRSARSILSQTLASSSLHLPSHIPSFPSLSSNVFLKQQSSSDAFAIETILDVIITAMLVESHQD